MIHYCVNGWGNVYREYQEHSGTVDANTPFVQYDYADGGSAGVAKYVRLEKVTYPDGREVNYDYGTAGAIDDIMSRLASIKDDDGSTVLASYKYLGAGRIVTEDYEEIEVNLDYNANDNLGGLDRFGRVADQVWNDYGATPDVVLDRYTYTYDRVGNRTSRDNELHAAFDEDYTYDALYRLTGVDRADAFDQSWDLDGLGNWGSFDDDGTSQTRTANEANEITGIDGSPDDVAHDAAGNMIRVPKLDGSGDHFHLVYDAWNRLVKVYDDNGTTLIAQYQYDGTGRRIVKGVDDGTDGSLDTFTHFFHNRDNQVLETRQGDDVSGAPPTAETLHPKHQNIWSPRYVDSLILRDDHDAQGGLIPANRLYYLNDANYNVTALLDATGDVAERYLYTPYGTVTVLDPDDFSVEPNGTAYDNTTLYTGREFDAETGLMYYRARYYHSELGRFVGRDPIGYGDGANTYQYVGDCPLSLVDPSGNETFEAEETHWWKHVSFDFKPKWESPLKKWTEDTLRGKGHVDDFGYDYKVIQPCPPGQFPLLGPASKVRYEKTENHETLYLILYGSATKPNVSVSKTGTERLAKLKELVAKGVGIHACPTAKVTSTTHKLISTYKGPCCDNPLKPID